MKKIIILIAVLMLSGCMTKGGVSHITTTTTSPDGTVTVTDDCSADYLNFKDSATTGVSGCGAGGTSEGATSNSPIATAFADAIIKRLISAP
jgi:hypothetical protein